jgi:hypothetical protein
MVAPGGPALDDDEEEQVERPQKGKKKKGIPTAVSRLFRSIRIADDAFLSSLPSTSSSGVRSE